jgi:hypothetical protein
LVAGHAGEQYAAASGADIEGAATIARFIAELQGEGLLAETTRPAKPEPVPVARAPLMRRLDDLQGLLVVEPIHEASAAGWPFG